MIRLAYLNRNFRSIRRSWTIVRTLSKYGFDNLLEFLNLSHLFERGRKLLRRRESALAGLSPARRMRLALEELGPTFIKLGQLLSTRPDLIPAPYIEEFSLLQDAVPSFSFEEASGQIRMELGCELDELFTCFDPVPVAAASIAQVHRARLVTGEEVVVKVRRPGIVALVESDIEALMTLALLVERHLSGSELYNPTGLVKEFARSIRREMDLAREGHTIERFAREFTGDPALYFPRVFWNATSRGVITMEYVHGIKVSDIEALQASGADLRLIARRGADTFLTQVLDHGVFHGDPHPGNVFILPGNVICLLDYGIVGRVGPEMRDLLIDLLDAIVNRDIEELVSLVVSRGDVREEVDVRALKRDLAEFVDNYYELPLKDISVGRMLLEFIEIVTTYRIRLEPDFMLLGKALVLIEGMGRRLDPRFDMIAQLRPFLERIFRERVSPLNMAKELKENVASFLGMARRIPRELKELFNRLNRDKFKIDLEHRGLDRFIRELDKSINRLSSSLIIAALVVGSSIIVHAKTGPIWAGFPLVAILGYLVAAFIGLWLVIAIFRSGRL